MKHLCLLGALMMSSMALGQTPPATAPNDITGGNPIGIPGIGGSTRDTQGSAAVFGLGSNQGATFTFNGSVTDVPSTLTTHWEDGIWFIDNTTIGTQIDDTLVGEGDFAEYEIVFSEPVEGLEFKVDDINFEDGFTLFAFDENNEVIPLTMANVAGSGAIVSVSIIGNGLLITNTTGTENDPEEFFSFTAPLTTSISRLEFQEVGKQAPSTNNGTVTLFYSDFAWANLSDLQTVKTLASGSSSTPAISESVGFDITVTNNGPADATNISLTDQFPTGLTLTGFSAPDGTFFDPGTGVWAILSLANGASVTLTLTGTVASSATGTTITNTATAATSSVQSDISTVGDDLSASITVSTDFVVSTGPEVCPTGTSNVFTNPNFDSGFTGWTMLGTPLNQISYTSNPGGIAHVNVTTGFNDSSSVILSQTLSSGLQSGATLGFDLAWSNGSPGIASTISITVNGLVYLFIDPNDNVSHANVFFLNGASGTIGGVPFATNTIGNLPVSAFLEWDLHPVRITLPSGIPDAADVKVLYNPGTDQFAIDNFRLCEPRGQLQASKTVATFDPNSLGVFAVPGNDMMYTLTISNVGGPAIGDGSIFLVDQLPEEVAFFYGDADGSGPATDPVVFNEIVLSGLEPFSFADDVGFSNTVSRPTSFADCTYTPAVGFGSIDPTVTYICFNPKGTMISGDPDPSFSYSFRVRIH